MAFGLKKCPGALDQKKRYSYQEKKKKKKDSIFLAAGQYIIYIFTLQIKMQGLCSYVAGKTKTYHQTLDLI